MEENWYALCISILNDIPPEGAFLMLYNDDTNKKKYTSWITEQDVEDMVRLKNECSYKEIGRMYGLDGQAVFKRIKRFKDKEGE